MISRFPARAVLGIALMLSSCALLSRPDAPRVQSGELDELSGLAVSHADPDLLWGHNDSGDYARLFRIGLAGEDRGFVPIPGAGAIDWEDIATFDFEGKPAVLIGDIGDNGAVRDHLTLYAVTDPGKIGNPELLWKLDFRYPEGPRDCEALAVDPVDRSILLISKRDSRPHIYRLPLPARASEAPAGGTIAVAESLGLLNTLPRPKLSDLVEYPLFSHFSGPTALDIAPSGRFAVVTTYKNAFLYRRAKGQSWVEAFAAEPRTIVLPAMRQTESGAISADETTLYVSSEGRHPPLPAVPLPR